MVGKKVAWDETKRYHSAFCDRVPYGFAWQACQTGIFLHRFLPPFCFGQTCSQENMLPSSTQHGRSFQVMLATHQNMCVCMCTHACRHRRCATQDYVGYLRRIPQTQPEYVSLGYEAGQTSNPAWECRGGPFGIEAVMKRDEEPLQQPRHQRDCPLPPKSVFLLCPPPLRGCSFSGYEAGQMPNPVQSV